MAKTLGELLAEPARTTQEQFVDFVQAYCREKGWTVPDRLRVRALLDEGVRAAIIYDALPTHVAAGRFDRGWVPPAQHLPPRDPGFRELFTPPEARKPVVLVLDSGIDYRALEERLLAQGLQLLLDGLQPVTPKPAPALKQPNRHARRRADKQRR